MPGGDLFGPFVAGVDVSDHAHPRIVGQPSFDLLPSQRRTVGDGDLAGVQ